MAELIARSALGGRSIVLGPIALREGGPGPGRGDSGLAYIEVSGAGTFDLLAIAPLAHGDAGQLVTRLAALRAHIAWRRIPAESARIAVDRFSADYLWEWLVRKAQI